MLTGMTVEGEKLRETRRKAKSLHRRAWASAHSGRFDLRQGHWQFIPFPCNRREVNSGGGRMRKFSSIAFFFFFNLSEISSEAIS